MKASYLKFRNEDGKIHSGSVLDESVGKFLKFQLEKDCNSSATEYSTWGYTFGMKIKNMKYLINVGFMETPRYLQIRINPIPTFWQTIFSFYNTERKELLDKVGELVERNFPNLKKM
ncbi:hypothetical protein [Cytophaga aurantiaca]|uniref:hypothetical protein n=1 Tax=Cytophaga aurantiaca TaxID=29530 RepID=UPI00036F221A|nr:hypothetical protein [Cytophaga aurantiaca]